MQVFCPHCQNTFESAQDADDEVLCPACGSGFWIDQERTRTQVVEHRKLGKFELLEQVGSGAFGAVWLARDTELDRLVAVKIPHSGNLATEQEAQRFEREARSAAQLRHPGIVTVHEVGRHDNLPYLVAEFIRGVTLTSYLESHRIEPGKAAELVAQVADALDYAHAMGVVHRDVKPSNIMIERGPGAPGVGDGKASALRPMLMDFGLALRHDAEATMTQEGDVLGTPAYMSPEQAAGHSHKVDARSDVYSLGVVLYRLLTGEVPFQGPIRAIIDQVLNDEPKPPRRIAAGVPRDLETICLKGMSKAPAGRYASAREFAEDLRRFLAGESIRARPAYFWERTWRWVRRHPAAAALATVSLIAALTLAGLGVALAYQGRLRKEIAEATRARADEAVANRRVAQALKNEEKLNYFNHALLAAREIEGNNVGRALDQLGQCPDLDRGWEWHYLKRQCHAEQLSIRAHQSFVYRLAYSPDGTRLVSAGQDGTVRVWDAGTGRQQLEIHGPGPEMFRAEFSPDGRHLAAIGNDMDRVLLFDARAGRQERSFPIPPGLYGDLAYSPDGQSIAVVTGAGRATSLVTVIDVATGNRRFTETCSGEGIIGVAFAPDGRRIAVAIGSLDWFTIVKKPGEVRILDVSTGARVATLTGHTGPLTSVAYSRDGKRLASGSMDHTARVYDAASGRVLQVLRGHTQMVNEVAFHPSGDQLATASDDNSIRVWDVASGVEVFTLRGHTREVVGLAFHPDGRHLASASVDGTIKVWNLTVKEALVIAGFPGGATGVTFLPDGKHVAAAALGGYVKVCDVTDGRVVETIAWPDRPVWDVACDPGGHLLALCAGDWSEPDRSGEVRLWNRQTGQVLHTLLGHPALAWRAVFSLDGTRIASVGGALNRPGGVKIWDVKTGRELLDLPAGEDSVMGLAFSPDGLRIASGGGPHGTLVKVWDVASGRLLRTFEGHKERVQAVAFSPDGTRLTSASYDGTVRVWDAATGRPSFPPLGHKSAVLCVAFSPDGRRIASGGEDLTIKLWDATNGQEALSLRGHNDTIWGVAFSPDGNRLASSSRDGTMRVWDATPSTSVPEPAPD